MKYLTDEFVISEIDNASDKYEKDALSFCSETGTRIKVRMIDKRPDGLCDSCGQDWFVVISRNGECYTLFFSNSKAEGSNLPTVYGILSSVEKYRVGSIDDFIAEFGYELRNWSDVERARKTYKAVKHEAARIMYLFQDCLEELREIQ